jgi:hypothetical protein
MKEEYDTIYQAGFLLQLDCPDLAIGMSGAGEANVPSLQLHLEALNWSRNAWNAMLPWWVANRSSPEATAALPPSQAY